MEVTVWLLAIVTSLLLAILAKWLLDVWQRWKSLPPGPWGLPYVGYLPIFKNSFQNDSFRELGKRYGRIFRFSLGRTTVVVFNDWESVKASLVDQPKVFNGRPDNFIMTHLSKGKGIGYNDSPIWRTQRNLTLKTLRNLGMGKKTMEDRLKDMVEEMTDKMSQVDGQVVPIKDLLYESILKVTWRLVLGDELDENKENFRKFQQSIHDVIKFVLSTQVLTSFPWLRFFPPKNKQFKDFIKANVDYATYLMKMIYRNSKRLDESSELNNFVDCYLAEIKKNTKEGQPPEPPYTLKHLMGIVVGLFTAGSTTVNDASLRGLLYLAHHPEVQSKAQAEIDAVVGRHRSPTVDDLSQLPYLDALVMELHRFFFANSLAIAHRATKSTEVLGYTIPKDASCVPNIHGIHHDPRLWDQPEVFKPERFIGGNNKAKAPPYLIPFSIGARICLGQSLAEMELRVIFSCLLHQFTFEPDPDSPTPTFKPEQPSNLFSVRIRKRKI